MAGVRYAEDLPNGSRVKRMNSVAKVLRCGPSFTPGQQDWNYTYTSDKDATWYSA